MVASTTLRCEAQAEAAVHGPRSGFRPRHDLGGGSDPPSARPQPAAGRQRDPGHAATRTARARTSSRGTGSRASVPVTRAATCCSTRTPGPAGRHSATSSSRACTRAGGSWSHGPGKSLLCYRVTKQAVVPADQPYWDYYARRGRPQIAIVVCSGPRLGPRNWANRDGLVRLTQHRRSGAKVRLPDEAAVAPSGSCLL